MRNDGLAAIYPARHQGGSDVSHGEHLPQGT